MTTTVQVLWALAHHDRVADRDTRGHRAGAFHRPPGGGRPPGGALPAGHHLSLRRLRCAAGGPHTAAPAARLLSAGGDHHHLLRSEEHTSDLQSLMRTSYAVFCLKKKNNTMSITYTTT